MGCEKLLGSAGLGLMMYSIDSTVVAVVFPLRSPDLRPRVHYKVVNTCGKLILS
jgi:hypothetical protein